jgi:uncharacterized membrane protein YraQ (UPF0718 family)
MVKVLPTVIQKGADFTAAFAFKFAVTNLVIELGVILWLLVSWQFTLAEYLGGLIMILLLALIFMFFLKSSLIKRRLLLSPIKEWWAEWKATMIMT